MFLQGKKKSTTLRWYWQNRKAFICGDNILVFKSLSFEASPSTEIVWHASTVWTNAKRYITQPFKIKIKDIVFPLGVEGVKEKNVWFNMLTPLLFKSNFFKVKKKKKKEWSGLGDKFWWIISVFSLKIQIETAHLPWSPSTAFYLFYNHV